MAFLKFSSTNCQVTSEVDSRDSVTVSVALSSADWGTISDALGEIANREGSELRTDFPEGWTIFWKIRDGDSRFFVAHPETDQWVATLAISESHLAQIRERIRTGYEGGLSELETVSRMSNFDVKVRVRGGAIA